MIAEDVHNVMLDLVRYGVPLETAVLEGWTLTKEMVRQTSKNQPGQKDQNVFEDVIDMRRILHTAVDAVHQHLNLEPVEWSHSTLRPDGVEIPDDIEIQELGPHTDLE